MNNALNKNLFFVKEHVKIFKAANSFDVIDNLPFINFNITITRLIYFK